MSSSLLDRAIAASWSDLGALTLDSFNESDVGYDPNTKNYHVFSTAMQNPGAVRVYTASTLAGIASATPTFVTNSVLTLTGATDLGTGFVRFTTSGISPVLSAGSIIQVQGVSAYSGNNTWVEAFRF